MDIAQQVAALPVRRAGDGTVQVLLVTSRETRRWVIPKGWPWPGHGDFEAAEREAWEEAGVTGTVRRIPLGVYHYAKRRKDDSIDVRVTVYAMSVEAEHERWPERKHRERVWFGIEEAAAAVAEPELATLIRMLEGLPVPART